MKAKPGTLESIAVRRAVVADADKVRYRVYSSPTEFIAVIAESALMAVKVAGIKRPHKIVRDLPTDGVAIEAKKMAAVSDIEAVHMVLPTVKTADDKRQVKDFMPRVAPTKESLFKPMNLGDLQSHSGNRARIIPPDLLNEIIEEHTKATMPAQALLPEMVPAATPAPEVNSVPRETTKESLMEMADNLLPPSEPMAQDAPLSPEEVEKLLNG
jgi:hypothetical protein